MGSAERLELHYYLSNESHSMDAYVRNKCELEILSIVQELADIAGVKIDLESEAYIEGGLKEVWKALGENNVQIAIVLSAAAFVLSLIPHLDFEGKALQNELTRLSIEEKKLAIQKLKLELEKENPSSVASQSLAEVASDSYKILVRKSNFYKSLSKYPKVERIGVVPIAEDRSHLQDEIVVERSEFRKYILSSNKLDPEIIDEAEIEIIAPVLQDGNYKWRGWFKEEAIPFSMNDSEFQASVMKRDISFQNGSTIVCELKIHKKLDEVGEIAITGYSVETVIEKIDGDSSIKTEQGKRYKEKKRLASNQGTLFE